MCALYCIFVPNAGAGHGVPTIRNLSEELCEARGTLIRINTTDIDVPNRLLERDNTRFLSLPLGALDALTRLSTLIDADAQASSQAPAQAPVQSPGEASNWSTTRSLLRPENFSFPSSKKVTCHLKRSTNLN